MQKGKQAMKKLIIASVAVALATVTSAANLNWGAFGALNDGGSDEDWYSGGQAYLVYVTDADNFAVANDLTITGGTVVQSQDIDGGYVSGAIDGSKIGGGLANGETYKFAVLFTTDGAAGTTMPTTGLYGVNDNEGSFYSVTWNKDTGGGFQNDGIYAAVTSAVGGAPVPEPTSGLLLLLGMAGLALKRKRA